MKQTLFLSMTLMLTASVLPAAVHAEPATLKAASSKSKLIKIDTKVGNGTKATAGREVAVHYTGWLYDEKAPDHHGKKFDSSRDRGQPIVFPLGKGYVIDGWEKGIEDMKVGGQRTLIIPPHMGYGESGSPGAIPPNATLVFDVELMGVR